MAHIHPTISTLRPSSLGAYRERDILLMLEQGLPDSFYVYHGLATASVHHGEQKFGELDAVVLSTQGHIVLLEIKSGEVSVAADGLSKSYFNQSGLGQANQPKDIAKQVHAQRSATISRLQGEGLGQVRVLQLLVLPDHHMPQVQSGTIAYPRDCIVDASELDNLCQRVAQIMPSQSIEAAERMRVVAFLENKFQLYPDVSSYVGQLERTSIALSDGLATWVPRISSSAGVYAVHASAGSGKTQLAVALLREAVARKERCAYVCFNRPLADHMVHIAPHSASITTFHELCIAHLRQHLAHTAAPLDFSHPHVFKDAQTQYIQDAELKEPYLDLLIIDEAQDFDPEWVGALIAQLKAKARLYILGDSNQDLYDRGAFELPEAVHIASPDNFRSPRRIVQTINALTLSQQPVVAKSLFEGWEPRFYSYPESDKEGLQRVQKCIHQLLDEGVAISQIVLLSYAGRERSHLLAQTHVGQWPLKRFTGRFDSAGNALWSDGLLLADTLHRFKGQAAPVVLLCEIDFEADTNGQISQRDLRKLFVGFTRAQFRLECVLSVRSEALLGQRLAPRLDPFEGYQP